MEIKLNIKGVQELAKKLDPVKREQVLIRGLNQAGELLKGWIQRNRLTGPRPTYLGVVTNRLRSSIATSGTERVGDVLTNKIGTNVKYARIHEYGGIINRQASTRHLLFKRFKSGSRKGLVRFSKEKKATFGRKVNVGAYEINMPARPFMRPSIEEPANQNEILQILTQNINEVLSA